MTKPEPLINWTPEFYDRLSKNYDIFARIFFSIGERGKSRVLDELCIGSVLDVACGSGALLAGVHGAGAKPYGSDTSWGMLVETKKKVPSAILVQANFYSLPFSEGVFDTVVETNAVSGMEIEPDAVLSEMVRVCKEGGEIRIGDYAQAPDENWWRKLMTWIGILFGDYPHDYLAFFRGLGYAAHVEYLGFDCMYQCARGERRSMNIYFACSITGGRADEGIYQSL